MANYGIKYEPKLLSYSLTRNSMEQGDRGYDLIQIRNKFSEPNVPILIVETNNNSNTFGFTNQNKCAFYYSLNGVTRTIREEYAIQHYAEIEMNVYDIGGYSQGESILLFGNAPIRSLLYFTSPNVIPSCFTVYKQRVQVSLSGNTYTGGYSGGGGC